MCRVSRARRIHLPVPDYAIVICVYYLKVNIIIILNGYGLAIRIVTETNNFLRLTQQVEQVPTK